MTVHLNDDQSLMFLDHGSWDQAAVIEYLLLELTAAERLAVVAICLSDGEVAGYLDVEQGRLL